MDFLLPIIMGGAVGFSLGFFGSGGSVLAVPILVYVIGMNPKEAIASSLVIVGATAVAGAVQKIRQNQVCFKVAVFFGVAGMVSAFLGAKSSKFISGSTQLIVFALLMLASSMSMFFKKQNKQNTQGSCDMSLGLAMILGLGVGFLTGLVGVGGGFLIVPALVALGGLNIRHAMGTSLLIISLNALSGVAGYIGNVNFDWALIVLFVLSSSVASVVGAKLSSGVNTVKMQKAFAVFILVVGIFVLVKNI